MEMSQVSRHRGGRHYGAKLGGGARRTCMELGFEARNGTEQLPLLQRDGMGGSHSSAASDASFTPLRSERDDMHAADATADAAADAAAAADEAYDPNRQMVSLLKPVSLTMVLVVYLVRTLGSPESLEGVASLSSNPDPHPNLDPEP